MVLLYIKCNGYHNICIPSYIYKTIISKLCSVVIKMSGKNCVPVTLVTGSLDAGKTTLFNHILKQTSKDGLKLVMIENEHGVVSVDSKLKVHQQKFFCEDSSVEVVNDGVPCTVRIDLIETIKKILVTKKLKIDGIFIETKGGADPAHIAHTFFTDPMLKKLCWIDSIVTVVDVNRIVAELRSKRDDGSCHESVSQVAFADVILLNKCDIAHMVDIPGIKDVLHCINSTAKIIECSHCAIDPHALLGVDSFSLDVKVPPASQSPMNDQGCIKSVAHLVADIPIRSVLFEFSEAVNVRKVRFPRSQSYSHKNSRTT